MCDAVERCGLGCHHTTATWTLPESLNVNVQSLAGPSLKRSGEAFKYAVSIQTLHGIFNQVIRHVLSVITHLGSIGKKRNSVNRAAAGAHHVSINKLMTGTD